MSKQGKAYSTVNTYRSAVSSVLEVVAGRKLGSHILVTRFMKGVFMAKPPQPKYRDTWDVRVVTEYLKHLSPYSGLKLKELTLKVATLTALASAQRCQSLQKLILENMTVYENKIVFVIKDRIKTSRPGKTFPNVEIPSFVEDINLCPRAHILHYIAQTEAYRTREEGSTNQLFISFCKPHKAVSSCTIARWLKTVLQQASIDTSIYKAHSFRAAVTSAALLKGASLSDILKLADWSAESTFNRFYNKPIVALSKPVGAVVLS